MAFAQTLNGYTLKDKYATRIGKHTTSTNIATPTADTTITGFIRKVVAEMFGDNAKQGNINNRQYWLDLEFETVAAIPLVPVHFASDGIPLMYVGYGCGDEGEIYEVQFTRQGDYIQLYASSMIGKSKRVSLLLISDFSTSASFTADYFSYRENIITGTRTNAVEKRNISDISDSMLDEGNGFKYSVME